jgi:hypothetical protein
MKQELGRLYDSRILKMGEELNEEEEFELYFEGNITLESRYNNRPSSKVEEYYLSNSNGQKKLWDK